MKVQKVFSFRVELDPQDAHDLRDALYAWQNLVERHDLIPISPKQKHTIEQLVRVLDGDESLEEELSW